LVEHAAKLLAGRQNVNRRCVPREWHVTIYSVLCRRPPLEAEDEEERVTEAMNNDIESIQRRIARARESTN